MKTEHHIFICTGDLSGDRLGAIAMEQLENLGQLHHNSFRYSGMGGQLMCRVAPGLMDQQHVQAAGLMELLPQVGRILKGYRRLQAVFRNDPPDLAILIDFPDFNLRLARSLKRKGVPVLYYGAPQAWAWREGRASRMKNAVDKLAVLFPFEESWFRQRGISTAYVAHPLAKRIPWRPAKKQVDKNVRIGLYPGSRTHEIEAIFPIQLQAAKTLRIISSRKIEFAVVAAKGREKALQAMLQRADIDCELLHETQAFDLAWCAAGTASLELTLRGIPWILTHRVHPLSYRLASRMIRTPDLGMAHILLKRRVAPELVQQSCNATNIARHSHDLLEDARKREEIIACWKQVREMLSETPQTHSVASLAFDMLGIDK